MRLALAIGCACLLAGCLGGDEPKVDPTQRDVNRIVAAVADVVYQCRAIQTGFDDRIYARLVRRDVDVLLDAWEGRPPGTCREGGQRGRCVRKLSPRSSRPGWDRSAPSLVHGAGRCAASSCLGEGPSACAPGFCSRACV